MAIIAEFEALLGNKLTPEQMVAIGSVRDVSALVGAANMP
jgi:hypothetical protein